MMLEFTMECMVWEMKYVAFTVDFIQPFKRISSPYGLFEKIVYRVRILKHFKNVAVF